MPQQRAEQRRRPADARDAEPLGVGEVGGRVEPLVQDGGGAGQEGHVERADRAHRVEPRREVDRDAGAERASGTRRRSPPGRARRRRASSSAGTEPVPEHAYCRALTTTLRCVSRTPLERPVVPPVYARWARSARTSIGTRGSVVGASAWKASKSCAPATASSGTRCAGSSACSRSVSSTSRTAVRCCTAASAGAPPMPVPPAPARSAASSPPPPPAVGELVGEVVRRQQRVGGGERGPGQQDAVVGDRVLRAVRQVHRDDVTAADSRRAQRRGERAGPLVQPGEAQLAPAEVEGGAVAEAAGRPLPSSAPTGTSG